MEKKVELHILSNKGRLSDNGSSEINRKQKSITLGKEHAEKQTTVRVHVEIDLKFSLVCVFPF